MRNPIILGLLCSSLTAAAAPPIIGGTRETGEPAVVMLVAYSADHQSVFTCTAVVISDTALLTAAHCVDHPGFSFGIFLGSDASGVTMIDTLIPSLVPVSATHPHPSYSPNPPTFDADIAVVQVASALPVTPLLINRTAPVPAMVGLDVKIVGYGQTVFGQDNALKFSATTKIAALDPGDTILIGDATARTCVGDSGGPALLSNVVLGIDSYSDTTGCGDPAHFRRTDAYLAFIDELAGTGPTMVPEDDPPVDNGGDEGGCSTGGAPGLGLGLLVLLLGRRARR